MRGDEDATGKRGLIKDTNGEEGKKRKSVGDLRKTTAATTVHWSGAIKVKYRTSSCLKSATNAFSKVSFERRAYARRMRYGS